MIVRPAQLRDVPGFLTLAAQVEHWFGPMVEDPGFRAAVESQTEAGSALVAVPGNGSWGWSRDGGGSRDGDGGHRDSPGARSAGQPPGLLGGLLFGAEGPVHHVHWLVVSEAARGTGAGRALLADAVSRFVRAPASLEVVTFGPDHPGAVASGARVFYERLGFAPAEPAGPGPEGGSRQIFRRTVP